RSSFKFSSLEESGANSASNFPDAGLMEAIAIHLLDRADGSIAPAVAPDACNNPVAGSSTIWTRCFRASGECRIYSRDRRPLRRPLSGIAEDRPTGNHRGFCHVMERECNPSPNRIARQPPLWRESSKRFTTIFAKGGLSEA